MKLGRLPAERDGRELGQSLGKEWESVQHTKRCCHSCKSVVGIGTRQGYPLEMLTLHTSV